MIFSVLITIILVLIPSTPLFIYILGCLLPKNHIISRTKSYKNITAERLWEILTDVESYPLWQPTLERIDYTSKKEKDCLVYTENTKRNKRITTTLILVNNNNEEGKQQQQQQIASRIIEEDSLKQQDKPTFVGTWTFKITNTMDDGVILEIEEKGSISRPMIRLLHLILLGFHRRLDRFLKDLGKKIQEEQQLNIKKQQQQQQQQLINQDHSSKYQQDKEEEEEQSSHVMNKNSTTIIESGASLLVQEEWDLMSEIYEKPETASIII
ncbi:hypothetical protein BDC45DRAFT_517248 [Circinella umbellata]|nr:hypothetical protein BDC45DRAFT_517248 [Circinella umbellata]